MLAAIAGIVDGVRHRGRVRRRPSSLHTVLTIVLLVVAVLDGFIHTRDGWTSVVPEGLILSGVAAVLVLVTSWLGYSTGRPVARGEF